MSLRSANHCHMIFFQTKKSRKTTITGIFGFYLLPLLYILIKDTLLKQIYLLWQVSVLYVLFWLVYSGGERGRGRGRGKSWHVAGGEEDCGQSTQFNNFHDARPASLCSISQVYNVNWKKVRISYSCLRNLLSKCFIFYTIFLTLFNIL